MPQIEFPEDQFQKLSAVAHAAGYADLPAFIASFANEPIEDPRGTLSDQELRESVAMIEAGHAEIKDGGGHDLETVMRGIAKKHNFPAPE